MTILVGGMAILWLGRELAKPAPFAWALAFLAPAAPANAAVIAQRDEGAAIDTRQRPAARNVAQVEGAIPIEPPPPETTVEDQQSYFPGVDAQRLTTISDGTPHRGAERDAYANLIETLATHDDAQLWASVKGTEAEQPLAFSLLFRQPNHYRGRLVHIQGKARGCVAFRSSHRIAEELAERMKAVPPGGLADGLAQALSKADFVQALKALDVLIGQLNGETVDVLTKEALSKQLGQIQDQLQIIADVQKSRQDRLKKERDTFSANGQDAEAATLTTDLQEASKRGQQTQKLAEAAHRLRECARLLLTGTKAEALGELKGLRQACIDLISRNYYHIWLETTEGQLVQAYVLELPAGFPVSKLDDKRQFEQEIAESIDLIGFFFKLLPYQAHDDARNAPLVFARTIVWSPPPPPPEAAALTWPLVLTVLSLCMVVGVLGAYLLTKGDALVRPRGERVPPTAAELAGLARLEALAQAEPAPAAPTSSGATSDAPAATPSPAHGHVNGHSPAVGTEGASAPAEGTSHP